MKLWQINKKAGRSWVVTLVVIAVVMSPLTIASSSGADDATWTNALPANFANGVQNSSPYAAFVSTSCSGLHCVAAGTFLDTSSDYVAMTEASSDGGITWGNVEPVGLTSDELNASQPDSFFNSVSCSGLTCVAAGYFDNTAGASQAMTSTSSDGGLTWSVQPTNIASDLQSASAPGSLFYSVSCTGLTCVAAGTYYDTLNTFVAMTDSSSDGGITWAPVQTANFAVGVQNPSSPSSYFKAVSCTGSTCVAAGTYYNADGVPQAMTQTSSDGGVTWSIDQPAQFPSGVLNVGYPNSDFISLSCSDSNCVAAGDFFDASGKDLGVTESSNDGGVTWHIAAPVTFAVGVQGAMSGSFLNSVSCTGSTCVVAGGFNDATGNVEAMTQTSSDGGLTWANAEPATFAAGVQNAAPLAAFATVSCAGSTCVAGGGYHDASGNAPAMTSISSDGGLTWSQAQTTVFSSGVQSSTPSAFFESSSCTQFTCVVSGLFTDVNGGTEAMTDTHLLVSSTAAVTNLDVVQSGTTLSATWIASPGATSYTCTLLFGFTTPSTFTSTTTGTTCSFTGLSASTPYGVAVVANGPSGASPSVSAFGTPTTTTTTIVPSKPRPVVRTIVCVRAKKIKRIRGVHPRCPAGYKKT